MKQKSVKDEILALFFTPHCPYAHSNSPTHKMTPVTTKSIRQKPMMSLAFILAIDKAGIAQNGCIRFVHASPHAIAMPVSPGSTPRLAPAVNMIGACIAQ